VCCVEMPAWIVTGLNRTGRVGQAGGVRRFKVADGNPPPVRTCFARHVPGRRRPNALSKHLAWA